MLRFSANILGDFLGLPLNKIFSLVDRAFILVYHRVSPIIDPVYQPIHPRVFEEHCFFLKKNYVVIPLSELLSRLSQKKSIKKMCSVTFDDGYHDFLEYAYPILNFFQIPVTQFLVSKSLETGQAIWTYKENQKRMNISAPCPQMLASKDLALFDSSMVEFGSHTCTHAFLDRIEPSQLETELVESKLFLEKITGRKIRYLAFPNGYYNQSVCELAKKVGYEAAFAVGQRAVSSNQYEPFSVPRFDVTSLNLGMFSLEVTGIVQAARNIRNVFQCV